jgi:predicted TIM-barrel fold metal-dependent hydrolase
MVIDFHTHIFPDKIARRTIEHLAAKAEIPPFSDGSVDGLLAQMEESGVDLSVTLPVLTSPAQFESVNRFAADVNARFANAERRLISFAGIHPKCEDIEGKMQQIKAWGFLGVKIHPDYQETFIKDEGYLRILEAARSLDLIVVTHAGVDVGYPDAPVRCTPALVREVIDRVY